MNHWIRLRKDLYNHVQKNVRALLGPQSTGLARYQKEYDKEFKGRWKPVGREHLLQEIQGKKFVFIGDFHALHQSQKAQLRILKSLQKGERVLCVEFLEARHQKWIDLYLAGGCNEREFLKSVEWRKNWGFPWEHYRGLFRWAQRHAVPVFGVNSKTSHRNARTLQERDRFSAELISKIAKQHGKAQVIVVYGDLHLAQKHLPAQLAKAWGKSFRQEHVLIFQNSERIYFQMLEKEVEHHVDVIKLSSGAYCLQNVPPWVKWQNYLMSLEQQMDHGFEDDSDFTDYVSRFIDMIGSELGVQVPHGDFSIYSSEDRDFFDRLDEWAPKKALPFLSAWIANDRSFYLAEAKVGYLARGSVNSAAQLAMAIVYSNMSQQKRTPWDLSKGLAPLIWWEAIFYFGSKLINPKRKTDTLLDVKAALSARSPSDKGREALRLAMSQKMHELMVLSGRIAPKNNPKKAGLKASQEAARILGGMLGEKLYHAYRKKLLSQSSLMALLKKDLSQESFYKTYWEILEIVENFPEPFLTKTEKL